MTASEPSVREDVMFVAGETDTIYQHVAALAILDTSGRPDFDYQHFRQHCIERAVQHMLSDLPPRLCESEVRLVKRWEPHN